MNSFLLRIIIMNKKTSILIIGASGQLGRSMYFIFNKHSEFNFMFANRDLLNLESLKSINGFFNKKKFNIVINCAAYTSVDKAETDIEKANQINHLAVKQLSKIVRDNGGKLIHISTDYVFDGKNDKPYSENDITEPVSVYGATKLEGEKAIKSILKNNAIIIRTSWLYSEYGKNFVRTMLKLGGEKKSLNVVNDQIGSPTYALDLAETIMTIIRSKLFQKVDFKTSIYHYSNDGICSWYDFANKIFEFTSAKCELVPIETSSYPTPAKDPDIAFLINLK